MSFWLSVRRRERRGEDLRLIDSILCPHAHERCASFLWLRVLLGELGFDLGRSGCAGHGDRAVDFLGD